MAGSRAETVDQAAATGRVPTPAGARAANGRGALMIRPAPTLRLAELVKRWPRLEHPVLDHVSLSVEPGRAIHVAGRNGVGKTTMLRVISGMIKPDSGSVALDDLDPETDRRAYQREIAFFAAGDRGLYARLTVRRHLDFWARVAFVPRASRRDRIERAVTRFGLEELATRRVDRLSMGQRQRVRLAGLLLHEPRLILLDEPLNSLDDDAIALMVQTLGEVTASGGSLIWCSPSADRSAFSFDRAYELVRGKLDG